MKKLVIGLGVVGALVFVGVPYVVGGIAESKIKEFMGQVNEQQAGAGKFEILDYKRGFRSSESSYRYQFSEAFKEMTQGVDSIDYRCEIDHGVMGVDYLCTLAQTGAYKEFLDQHLDGVDPFSMNGSISAFNSIDQNFVVEPLAMTLDDATKVTLPEKIEIESTFDQDISNYTFEGELPKLTIENKGLFDLNDVAIAGSFKEAYEGLYLGDAEMSVDELKISEGDTELSFAKFEIDTAAKEIGDTITSSVALNADNLVVPNQDGSKDEFSKIAMEIDIAGMDTKALIEYTKIVKEMQASFIADGRKKNNQAGLKALAQLTPVLNDLLKKDLGVNVNSSFKLDGEKNNIGFDLKLLKDMELSEMMVFAFSPDEALKNFKGSVNVDIKKELIEKYPAINLAVASLPLFVQNDEGVTMDLNLDSELKLNGKVTTVAEIMALF